MDRKILLASHNHMASGLKSSIEFLAGEQDNLMALDAYVDGQAIDQKIKELFAGFPKETEVLIFTDLLSGSVNQKLFPYRLREHTHLITGMNLPIVLSTVLKPSESYLSNEEMRSLVEEARTSLVYVNELNLEQGGEDE
ncbi:PTS sugar transporter subunit IIA [Streptococcus sobrinus]|nr:PTS system IIA component [Streptococcus sobrinus]AWN20523.1 PTS N-acetylglucosamine transporter subunit IIBC [Streptococcus sobrinus]EMP72637.1 putative PTS system IIA component [Streptococcus sobrinus DSM 20742 = ATCC 33478]OZV23879.1 PTS N-acetylglucosamine transporter subunit IIBC [Streptococcus sobrinus]SQG13271.1 PTS system transporter subunit IIA [Streptococcus sobrinus]